MQCFLTQTEFATLNNTIRKRMKRLSNQIKSIPMNNILSLLGFPPNWYKLDALPQK